mmetsp:Transcript_4201/g.15479  ORF Transcript_4201/g.15479 Transcript_4201/m.15479 type:complete len:294 (-) Transcript_4201:1011-1892(-)
MPRSIKIVLTVITTEESVACHGRWSSGDGPVEQTSHNAGTWASEKPSAEDDTDELPVDSSDVSVAKSDSSGGTGDAVSGGDRNSETREGHHSEHSSQLDTEAAGRRLKGQAVAKSVHDVVAHRQQTDVERETSVDQKPDGNLRLACNRAGAVDHPDSSEGSDSVSHVVGAVGDGEEAAGGELEHLEHLLGLGVSLEGLGVHGSILLLEASDVHVESREDALKNTGEDAVVLWLVLDFILSKVSTLNHHGGLTRHHWSLVEVHGRLWHVLIKVSSLNEIDFVLILHVILLVVSH